jgi:hypothetical protein
MRCYYRSVRQNMADARRQEDGETEDAGGRADAESDVQRAVHVPVPVRASPTDEPRCQRHGSRPFRKKRAHRQGGTRRQERTDRGQTLERDVRQDETAGRPLARSEGLQMSLRRRRTPEVATAHLTSISRTCSAMEFSNSRISLDN